MPPLADVQCGRGGHLSSAPWSHAYGGDSLAGARTGTRQNPSSHARGLHLESVPCPVLDAEAVRHIIGGLVVAGHRFRCCPSEVVVQHLSQCSVVGHSDICKSLVKACNRTAIHFAVLSIAAVHLDDGGLVTIGVGVYAGTTEGLGPVSGESLDMLGVEAVAERMTDHVVGQHPTMPGVGKAAQAVMATRRVENSFHASIMTIVSRHCKTRPGEFVPVSALITRPL